MEQPTLFDGVKELYKQPSFHNTTNESPKMVKQYNEEADKQDKKVLALCRKFDCLLNPHDLMHHFPSNVPITSIRRSFTTLTKDGKLYLSGEKKDGPLGRTVCLWGVVR